jgi:hypothetical protein
VAICAFVLKPGLGTDQGSPGARRAAVLHRFADRGTPADQESVLHGM